MAKKADKTKVEDLAGQQPEITEDLLMVRLIATFAAATRLSGKKLTQVDDAAEDTIRLAKKLEKHILEG